MKKYDDKVARFHDKYQEQFRQDEQIHTLLLFHSALKGPSVNYRYFFQTNTVRKGGRESGLCSCDAA